MSQSEIKFNEVVNYMLKYDDVGLGSMMYSPGIQFYKKNFAFLQKKTLVFGLGRECVPENLGITNWKYFSPFKKKSPLYDWFCVTKIDAILWIQLAEMALTRIKSGK